MARLLTDIPLCAAILNGEHDEDLQNIMAAVRYRTKTMWHRGQEVRIVGTKNPELEGQFGKVLKVNTKTVTVGVGTPTTTPWGTTWSVGEFNCSPGLLEAI